MKPKLVALLFIVLAVTPTLVFSQCMNYPVPLQERVEQSKYIVLGRVTAQEPYLDDVSNSVYTLNKVEVTAWLKNGQSAKEVYLITAGGVLGNRATIVYPSLQLNPQEEYLFFLQGNTVAYEHKRFRKLQPQAMQTIAYADAQGALLKQFGQYVDLLAEPKQSETALFGKISRLTGSPALTPTGTIFAPRVDAASLNLSNRIQTISSFTPTTTRAGTIVTGDEITISGSSFGATAGTVFFTNADDGGASFISSGLTSDIISWSTSSIRAKVPGGAGTGRINVNGTFTSASNLNVQYALIDIASSFDGFGSSTRQRYYLRNLNSQGGYTFRYNTSFASNTAAVSAMERAFINWRCATGVNFRSSATTTTIATSANDGTNVVYFDPALPAGTLGVAVSQFNGFATGLCNLQNTVWWLADVDISYRTVPGSFTWEFGPAAPSITEFDFESVALHELGHAHGLRHVIAPGQVMHFALSNGAASRTLASNDIAAGNEKMGYSVAATCFNPPGSGTPMTAVGAGVCTTLPVELVSFTARRQSVGTNLVSWNTAAEINNDGFVIERSEDGTRFQSIGWVKGEGSSFSGRSYNFEDRTAGPFAWYYRLTQKDLDGRQRQSGVVFVPASDAQAFKVWSDGGGSTLQVYRSTPLDEAVVLILYNANGQTVSTTTLTSNRTVVDCSRLAKGMYTYRITAGAQQFTGRLVLGNR